jgi:dTDP-4-amino-4,6-dideoxygalactose transaminase
MNNWEKLHRERNKLMNYASAQGVATRQGTQAVHGLSIYETRFGYKREDLPQAWLAEQLTIALPLYPQMTDSEQDYVVETIIEGQRR